MVLFSGIVSRGFLYDFFSGKTVKKPSGIILVLAFVVCATTVQIARAQEQCTTDADCIQDNLFCNGIEVCLQSNPAAQSVCESTGDPCETGETCVEETGECAAAVGCVSDDECDDGLFCNGFELCADGECVLGTNPCEQGETCEEGIDECTSPECVIDADCAEGEICSLNVCVDPSGCVLTIKPGKVHINTMFRPVERRFRIIGSEGFDPRAAIDFGPVNVTSAAVNSKGVLKVLVTIPAGAGLSKGPVQVSVGECVGEILLK